MRTSPGVTTMGLVLGVLASCASPSKPAGQLHLATSPAGKDTRVTLLAAPGLKVNARLEPALELPDGRVLRFRSPHLTPDSAYFAEPPSALMPGRHARVHGRLRASVCDAAETVCRSVLVEL